jgi:hypothetical protein
MVGLKVLSNIIIGLNRWRDGWSVTRRSKDRLHTACAVEFWAFATEVPDGSAFIRMVDA